MVSGYAECCADVVWKGYFMKTAEGFCIQTIDGMSVRLRTPFDLSFIGQYGTVFKVFDEQDSGNLCFGVQDGGKRFFIKFAGAPTIRYSGTPEGAVARLKATMPVYRDLVHYSLIRFIKAEEISDGYAAVFEWTDAECMGRQYPQAHRKFMQLPLKTKIKVYDAILEFHAHVSERVFSVK